MICLKLHFGRLLKKYSVKCEAVSVFSPMIKLLFVSFNSYENEISLQYSRFLNLCLYNKRNKNTQANFNCVYVWTF